MLRSKGLFKLTWFLAGAGCLFAFAAGADASDRRFTFSYEALTQPKGSVEYEQWVTWKTTKRSDRSFDRFDFRHEIEWGITDRFQLALYLADWRFEETSDTHKGDFRDVALEAIYNLSNPVTDPLGLALYGEIQIGDQKFELEGKIIAEKVVGPWSFVYNFTLEAEWEGAHFQDDKGKIQQTLGVSYQISPKLLVGAELLHELAIPDWRGVDANGAMYVGPNVSMRTETWWATLTPMFQVTDIDDEPDFQMRLLVGFPIGGKDHASRKRLARNRFASTLRRPDIAGW
ncbi:MAG: hypothetical protein IID33_07330 [Planctomycetes bacterium]|nr:hypothetical protein [Planctomycetota bacterium]